MDHPSILPMDRPLRVKGFTLVESMLVLAVLSMFILLSVPIYRNVAYNGEVDQTIEQIAIAQLNAIAGNRTVNCKVPYESFEIQFLRTGNVLKARTIDLSNGVIIVTLGTGRVYEKRP